MANSTRFLIELPDVGQDSETWGTLLNNAFSALEQRVTDRANGDTIQSNLTVNGTFNVTGNTVLGDAAADALTINPSTITHNNPVTHTNNHTFSGNVSVQGNTVIGDAGTDTATLNAQLSANASVGTAGQVLSSRGPNLSPRWVDQSVGGANAKIFFGNAFSGSSGSFTIPSGVTTLKVTVVGAGGAGSSYPTQDTVPRGGAGGAGGGIVIVFLTGLTPGLTLNWVTGSGGLANPVQAANSVSGGNGGNSSVTSGTQTIPGPIVALGGEGALGSITPHRPGRSGSNAGAFPNYDVSMIIDGSGGDGGTEYLVSSGVSAPGDGGNSPLTGSSSKVTHNGANFLSRSGLVFGAGGTGGYTGGGFSDPGGNGSAGVVIFEW